MGLTAEDSANKTSLKKTSVKKLNECFALVLVEENFSKFLH